ncbi:MAG: hypothetical protein JW818_10375 [Pirellulales bacterium]|nr:hypothetical protein [Pirellulales bacterium]
MRVVTLVLNAIVVIFFLCFLAYTFFARQHLDGLARDFVTEKTLDYSKPIVEIADEALDSPLVQKLLSDNQAKAIRREIRDYQNDPAVYVSDLTRQQVRKLPLKKANPLLAKVASIKEKIRIFYDNTLNALINDLRIFSASNLVAGMIAFGLACFSSSAIRQSLVWFSFLMFVGVLGCSYLYIDDLTFFRILFRAHMGWWYSLLLCVVIVALYLDYGHHAKATEPVDEPETPIQSKL